MIARALLDAVILAAPLTQARAACYVAYIHGKGSNLTPGVASDTDRRNYWRNGASDTWGDFVLWSGVNAGCTVLITGYDGAAGFWDLGASGAVAQQINAFIQQHARLDDQSL